MGEQTTTTAEAESGQSPDALRLAVANQKGGVGKTTVSINLAGAFNDLGYDVCVVDADPQGNATEGLGFATIYERQPPSMHDVLTNEQYDVISDLVVEHDEVDLVPANVDMFKTERELVSAIQGELRLDEALDALEAVRSYDVIIIDAPPHLFVLNDSALLAAEHVVIPAQAESTSQRALDILFDQIDTLEDQFDQSISEVAIVANRVEPDGEADEMMQWFEETFGSHLPVVEVRKRVALKRAWKRGVSTFAHDEHCDMGAEFRQLAQAIVANEIEATV